MSKKEVRHLEESRNDLAERYQEQKARAERLATETSRLSARVKVLEEALGKAQALYVAACRSLEDTDEDPEAERGMEMRQVYTLAGSWARLCDAVDEIDVDGPGFKHLLSTRAGEGGA